MDITSKRASMWGVALISCGRPGNIFLGGGFMPRTCFVISPIGEPDSSTRQKADDLLELIVDPALESLGFTIIRADKIIGSNSITSDIVNLVQNADLCIIDLTGHNANVFYECGRRHETARPFIQVMRRGDKPPLDKPPFDLAGIRTIFYDISDAREVRNAVLEVRQYAEAVIRNPAASTQTSMSATSIADALDRLERKVDQLSPSRGSLLSTPPSQGDLSRRSVPKPKRRLSPQEMYLRALAQEDWESAAEATILMKERHGLKPHVVAAAATIARAGQSAGATILYEVLDDLPPWVPEDDEGLGRDEVLRSLARYYVARDQEDVGIAKLQQPITELYSNEEVPTESRAWLANSLEMLAYGSKDYATGVEWGIRACELDPDESAYWVNLSMCYEAQENLVKAKDSVDKALRDPLANSSAGALNQAIDVYSALGDKETVARLFDALNERDPDAASFKQFLLDIEREPR